MTQGNSKEPRSTAAFTLAAFGDEIDPDLGVQLDLLLELRIGYLELRSAWGTNVLKLDDSQVAAVRAECERRSIMVSCIGSPIGKTPIEDPLDTTLGDLDRMFRVAEELGTDRVRVFSFYPPDGTSAEGAGQYLDEAISRLRRMADRAQRRGMLLLLENERGVVGDTPERCRAILEGVDSSQLRFVWDTANFVVVGVDRPTERSWTSLAPYLSHVQVKDALLSDGTIKPAGQGDGQVAELLARLRDSGYRGVLALEPHLALAGRSGGFSGPDGMRLAVSALRGLMADLGCAETPARQP